MNHLKHIVATVVAVVLAACILTPLGAKAAPAAPNCNIVYQFPDGNVYAVSKNVAMSLMQTNPDGSYYIDPQTKYYVVDPNKLLAFLNALQVMFPQNQNALTFYATSGETHYLRGDGYTNNTKRYLNVPREMAYLPVAIMAQANEIHQPELSVGNTYIEVDISDQQLYYYENLQKKFQTPVVTGNTNGHNTPQGIFYVRGKSRNVTLKGEDYESFVNYWMPIVGNSIGIHDATWRSRFGGNIYRGGGSHGCINVPLANEEKLYGMVQTGTPVVVHQ